MGVDKLSVSPRTVNLVKAAVAATDASTADAMVTEALAAATADEVRSIIARSTGKP